MAKTKKKARLVSAPQAALIMGINSSSLYQYMKAGKFQSAVLRNGTRWFLAQWEIDLFLENKIDVSGTYSDA